MLIRIDELIPAALLRETQQKLAGAAFEDGRLTAGADASKVKKNLELLGQSPVLGELRAAFRKRLAEVHEIASTLFPQRISEPLFVAYGPGMEYGLHFDNALMASPAGTIRSDIAMTIFLAPPESYGGGELVIEDVSLGNHHVKLPAGSAFAYPATTLHRVAPVTSGTRLVCVLWIQSHVRDAAKRRILVDLDMATRGIKQRDAASPELKLVSAAYHNLLRLWAD